MERVGIKVDFRQDKGKENAKKIRKNGFIPAVVYGPDTNISLNVPFQGLKVLRSMRFSESSVVDLTIEGDKKPLTMPVLIKEVQFHPVSDEVIHIDFLKVSLTEKIKVHVPIVLKGESKGVKEADGTVDQILRELEVEGFPLDIPESIDLDISELEIGNSMHVSDLNVTGNIKVITEPTETIVTVLARKEEPEEEVVAEEPQAEEPEVIKEKKEGSEEASPEEKKEQ